MVSNAGKSQRIVSRHNSYKKQVLNSGKVSLSKKLSGSTDGLVIMVFQNGLHKHTHMLCSSHTDQSGLQIQVVQVSMLVFKMVPQSRLSLATNQSDRHMKRLLKPLNSKFNQSTALF